MPKPTPKPTIKVTPKATPKPSPMSAQVKAMNNLIAERQAYAKAHGGNYPSDEQLMKSRKKSGM